MLTDGASAVVRRLAPLVQLGAWLFVTMRVAERLGWYDALAISYVVVFVVTRRGR